MLKFITNNWQAKLVCLILATALWAYVAIGESQVDNLPGNIPLKIINIPQGLVPILDQDTVQVKISADRSVWNIISANSISAAIDLNGLTQGTHEVQVSARSNIANVEIVEVVPNKVLVRLEPIAKKNVSVKVQVEGQAGEGLVPGDAVISPDTIEVSGAQSVIEKILEATVIIKLNGETNQIEKNIELVALDSKGEIIKNITFSPKEAKVSLPIVKAGTSKTVGIKVNTSGQPKSGYWVSGMITTPDVVTAVGASGILRGINYIETKTIDIEGIDASVTKSIGLNLPSGVSLTDDIGQIKVEIKVTALGSSKEIDGGIIYENLAPNLKVASITPSNIKISISGPIDLLNNASSNNVQIHFNLSGFSKEGEYPIDIGKNMISVPSGINIVSFVPSSVRLNLSNK